MKAEFTFVVTIRHDCDDTLLVDRVVSNMAVKVDESAVSQDHGSFEDSKGQSHGNATYCGVRRYTLSPTKGFLSHSGTALTLQSSSPGDVGVHAFTLTIDLVDYPSITPIVKSF
jgi:hypothetical protein